MIKLNEAAFREATIAFYDNKKGPVPEEPLRHAIAAYIAYAPQQVAPKGEPNQGALAAIDKLMHAWVMGERWVRLDDVKAALATPKHASTQPVGEAAPAQVRQLLDRASMLEEHGETKTPGMLRAAAHTIHKLYTAPPHADLVAENAKLLRRIAELEKR